MAAKGREKITLPPARGRLQGEEDVITSATRCEVKYFLEVDLSGQAEPKIQQT